MSFTKTQAISKAIAQDNILFFTSSPYIITVNIYNTTKNLINQCYLGMNLKLFAPTNSASFVMVSTSHFASMSYAV